MKRQYIDFIPYNDNSTSPLFTDEISPVQHKSYAESLVKSKQPQPSPRREPQLGVIEDTSYDDSYRFDDETDEVASVKYHAYPVAPSLQSANSENLTNKPLILRKPRTVAQPIERAKDLSGYHPPKIPFINTTVEKRPLSKNIYGSQNIFELAKNNVSSAPAPRPALMAKQSVVPEPEPEADIFDDDILRVVDEPAKKSHAGVIFAIIASILLGAAAGVVIYLFFP